MLRGSHSSLSLTVVRLEGGNVPLGHSHLVRDVVGRGGIQSPACWLVQQVGVSCWTLPSRERQDKSLQDAGLRCSTFNNKKECVEWKPPRR